MCDARPHCRTPDACVAKGAGHCRSCAGRAVAAKRFADPAQRESVRQRMIGLNRDPVMRKKMSRGLKRNMAAIEFYRRSSRKKLVKANTDPVLLAKREAAKTASLPRMRETKARNLAVRLGIPLSLIPEYRLLVRQKLATSAEALDILRSSFPAAFAALDVAAGAETVRDLGPAPAIGMPERAAWTQRANAIRSGAPA